MWLLWSLQTWAFKLLLVLKSEKQISHLWVTPSIWKASTCICMWLFFFNLLSQTVQIHSPPSGEFSLIIILSITVSSSKMTTNDTKVNIKTVTCHLIKKTLSFKHGQLWFLWLDLVLNNLPLSSHLWKYHHCD